MSAIPTDSEHRAEAERRLAEELRLIAHHGLCGFFLVYHDLFDLAREVAADVRRGSRRAAGGLLPGRGRGSSVSSIVCYLLGLSHVDPVATRLFFGRFLNETLASVPDIDLDFPREIREELIRRVYKRYGDEHVGLVCSVPDLSPSLGGPGDRQGAGSAPWERSSRSRNWRTGGRAVWRTSSSSSPASWTEEMRHSGRSCVSSRRRSPACRVTCRSMSAAW